MTKNHPTNLSFINQIALNISVIMILRCKIIFSGNFLKGQHNFLNGFGFIEKRKQPEKDSFHDGVGA